MFSAVADTHTALWYLFADTRLSAVAKAVIREVEFDRRSIAVSTISIAGVIYLVEKRRIAATAFDELVQAMNDPGHVFAEVPFTVAVAGAMRLVSRDEVSDLPDRIVAATGVYLDVPVISRDRLIRAASLRTIW